MTQREQEEIRCRITEANRNLTWDDTRLMPLTSRVRYFCYWFIHMFGRN